MVVAAWASKPAPAGKIEIEGRLRAAFFFGELRGGCWAVMTNYLSSSAIAARSSALFSVRPQAPIRCRLAQ
jgi:hypothetical protein